MSESVRIHNNKSNITKNVCFNRLLVPLNSWFYNVLSLVAILCNVHHRKIIKIEKPILCQWLKYQYSRLLLKRLNVLIKIHQMSRRRITLDLRDNGIAILCVIILWSYIQLCNDHNRKPVPILIPLQRSIELVFNLWKL